jgi:DNA-binding transcriptional LysR family regulator
MDIQTLKNFLILCETLNFRIAAERISIVQPALSRQIQLLEENVGALLFERDKRNVNLTEAGHYFRKECERILGELEKAITKTSQLHNGEAGEINIGHSSSAMQSILPQFLISIKKALPDIRTSLSEIANRQLIEMLLHRKIDIAFGPNIVPPSAISSKIIYEENFVIVLPKNHPVSANNFTDLSVFANENFIIPPLALGYGYVEVLLQICQQHGFNPNIVHESAHSLSVQRLVEAGMGISIEPLSSVRGYNMKIKVIELKKIKLKAQMKMLWLEERGEELSRFLELVPRKMA